MHILIHMYSARSGRGLPGGGPLSMHGCPAEASGADVVDI